MTSLLVLLLTVSTTPAQVPDESADEAPAAEAPAQAAPAAPAAGPPPADVVLQWNEVALQAIKTARTPPPLAARNLAMVHTAIYDAVNGITHTHQTYRVSVNPSGPTCLRTAAAIAAHRVLVSLYPGQVESFDTALDTSLEAIEDGEKKTAGARLGQQVAEDILAWRAGDKSDRPIAYTPRVAVGSWRPTPPGYKAAMLPHWRYVTPFAMTSTRPFQPPAPPALDSEVYTRDFNEVKMLGARQSTVRTPEQTVIALFWDDSEGTVTPPGHWNRVAQAAARQRRLTLPETARLFALLNISLADAAILCWECKFQNAFWRPVTAIHEADRDGNPATLPDAEWMSLLTTPPFPSYTSGHSTFSGAAAAALIRFFGSDEVPFTLVSDGTPDAPRTYRGFWQAAEEAGRSRIFGGIHYQFENREGLASGRALGEWVVANVLQPLDSAPQSQTAEKRLVPVPAYRRPAVQPGAPFHLAIGRGAPAAADLRDEREGRRRYSILEAQP
jgi:hypothetical protein